MKAKRETPERRSNDRRGGHTATVRTSRRTGPGSVVDSPSRRTRPGRSATPTREARSPKSGPQTSPIPRPVDRPARPKNTSQAKARAKARKAKAPKVVRPKLTERLAIRLASIDWRPSAWLNRVPFVVLVIGSLAVGLGLTLWLSTDAAERSYQLSHARERTRMLQQQKEALERDVREAESAPALAEAARRQGMIPTQDTAHLVQGPDGNWVVVGTPKPADGVPPPPLNTPLPEEGPPPPNPQAVPPEVSVRVTPAPGDAPAPPRTGPQLLLRTPDGASTLGATPVPGQLPLVPGQPPLPGQVPVPEGQVPVPGQVPMPEGAVPAIPGQVPPVPGQAPAAPAQVPAQVPVQLPPDAPFELRALRPTVPAPPAAPAAPAPVPPQPAGAPQPPANGGPAAPSPTVPTPVLGIPR
ncbi:hypothetical protein BST27_06625 [Mycobacterium intermedium]|uniref:Uncharacterized protein n=1 Tax=Mycobacterium intermedium TaxID=28445 RepID=A0A1E3SFS4_MYCIE|nr:hypothetical protein [Mycobacterium intermedium]MCV6967657.1 hypothetical protein [Mycobacterium intermedium]ODR00438.1 hypothetical protein BHQ20_12755 [Mycobacterium intermedium]OPE46319.1 hypothetical protein BV508_26370 [Mycobacterium intermedium]ORB09392.1 hypothetical protein BST27_06625 [Mycobacterium intermedium]